MCLHAPGPRPDESQIAAPSDTARTGPVAPQTQSAGAGILGWSVAGSTPAGSAREARMGQVARTGPGGRNADRFLIGVGVAPLNVLRDC